jgi:PAS domain S-box-containing protein
VSQATFRVRKRGIATGLFAAGLVLSAAPEVAAAGGPELRPPGALEHVLESWQSDRGLPQNTVFAIARTTDGYLWLGTEEGLVRFDGVRFVVTDGSTAPQMRSNDVRALLADPDGSLWIGTNGGGLLRLEEGTLTVLGTSDGLAGDAVLSLHKGRQGVLWIGTTRGLSRLEDKRIQTYTTRDGLPHDHVLSLREDHEGRLWIGTRRGLVRMENGTFTTYTTKQGLARDEVHALCVDRLGQLWVGTAGGGLTRLKDGAFQAYTTRDGLPGEFVRALLQDSRGDLWIGTNGGGLARLRDGAFEAYSTRQGLSSDLVFALAEDPEGNLWVGTNGGGLARLRARTFASITTKQGLSHDVVLPIYEDRAGSVWVGTAGGGLNRLRDGRVTRYTARNGLPADLILSLAEDAAGKLWVGTLGGLSRMDRGSSFKTYTTHDGLTQNAALTLLGSQDGSLWIGTNGGGLNRFEDGRFTAYTRQDGLADDVVWCLLEAAGDTLWIGTSGGLSRLQKGRITTYTTRDGLPAHEVMALHADADGALWIGTTGGGLGRLKDGRFAAVTTREGLFDNTVLRILEDSEGYFWMSSNKGVFRVRKSDLDDVAEGRTPLVVSLAYGTADGMATAECNGGVSPAGWRMRDGRLWFPTLKGVAVVDPRRVPTNTLPPPVVVEEVVVDHEALDARRPARLPPGWRHVEFRYTASSFVAPEKVRFRYRLEGFDPGWIEAADRRRAHYTSLLPGKYRFRVIAANNDRVWNESGASFAFEVQPHFHQTYFFYALCLLVAGAVGAGVYRFRMERVREIELQALVGERTRDLQRAKQGAEEALREVEGAKGALARSEAKFRSLIQNSSDIVMVVDGRGTVVYASPSAGTVLDRAPESLLGAALLDFVHPEDASAVRAELDPAARGRPATPARFRFRHHDGSWRTVEAVAANLLDDTAVAGIVLNARDLTEQKALEDQLRQAQKMEAVGRLAGGIAHDFNNLLSVILGQAELMLSKAGTADTWRRRLEQLRHAAQSGAALTRQLLAFSRRQVLEPKVLDLNQVVRGTEDLLRRVIGEDVELVATLAPDLGSVRADPGQIEQVLMNLAVNARDAMPQGGRLTIETANVDLDEAFVRQHRGAAPGPHVVLSVSDTGCGMDAETLAHVFEPFFTTKPEGKGTGLGLSTVYGIIEQSGGSIRVSSEAGRGTSFRCYLPRVEAAPAAPQGAVAPLEHAPAHETVLLVEDEASLRELAREVLEAGGYTVLEAANGAEALALAERHNGDIHLLVTDVVMPRLGGRAVAERLASLRPRLRVLYLSGYTDDAVLQQGVVAEDVAFLQKPFTPDNLLGRVRQVLGARRAAAGEP